MTNDSGELHPLTSLRFFAALMIVLYHAQPFPWPWLKQLPGGLPAGVSFFFVLSGFILTHVYRSRQVSYSRFVWLRIARLWPVHVAMLVFVAMLLPARDAYDSPLTALANLFLLQSYVPLPASYLSWNGASWSISTEFFFYLLFPLLLAGIDRTWPWKLGASLALSLSIIVAVTWFNLPQSGAALDLATVSFVIPFPPMRLAEFCLGMTANVLWARHIRPLKAGTVRWTTFECGAVAITAYWLLNLPATAGKMPVYAMSLWMFVAGGAPVFAGLIVVLASGRGLLGRLLCRRELVYLGAISFPLYLLHQPVMRIMLSPDATEAAVFAALLAGSIALHEVVEKPARAFLTEVRWQQRLVSRQIKQQPRLEHDQRPVEVSKKVDATI